MCLLADSKPFSSASTYLLAGPSNTQHTTHNPKQQPSSPLQSHRPHHHHHAMPCTAPASPKATLPSPHMRPRGAQVNTARPTTRAHQLSPWRDVVTCYCYRGMYRTGTRWRIERTGGFALSSRWTSACVVLRSVDGSAVCVCGGERRIQHDNRMCRCGV
jgi:hypothetical protein